MCQCQRRLGIREVAVRIGAHMSISGGVHKALIAGKSLGCEAIQIFTKSPGNWRVPELTSTQLDRWEEVRGAMPGIPVVAHDCYLVNLASPDKSLRERSIHTLLLEMKTALKLGIELFVIHPGAHTGGGESEGLKLVSGALDRVLSEVGERRFKILLEKTAGQGTSLGYRFEQLAAIMGECSNRAGVGVCVDTCHIFAAGYDIRKQESYDLVMEELDRVVGLDHVGAVHVNDSKKALGSRVDRHEHIGKGQIGAEGISLFLTDRRLHGLPFILETPKGIGDRMDRRNLKMLRKMREKGNS